MACICQQKARISGLFVSSAIKGWNWLAIFLTEGCKLRQFRLPFAIGSTIPTTFHRAYFLSNKHLQRQKTRLPAASGADR
jgi:hypothetical protein